MKSRRRLVWLILAIVPFAVTLLLYVALLASTPYRSNSAGHAVFGFIVSYWWLIIIVATFIDWIAYLVHVQHSQTIKHDDRMMWTFLLLFLTPFANLFYYRKFIAPRDEDLA